MRLVWVSWFGCLGFGFLWFNVLVVCYDVGWCLVGLRFGDFWGAVGCFVAFGVSGFIFGYFGCGFWCDVCLPILAGLVVGCARCGLRCCGFLGYDFVVFMYDCLFDSVNLEFACSRLC